ncbi:uncharacterized protein IL334_007359 [Kwoniella shivajii]|uniref:Uncharacterized protein n=1 Tax=Kwoniella shivajii TaxID=564305 RepID=A0ABZ1D8G4_9TREE|nr:hypothetical protein IL334_007359 [Kwoniella shivajii]
MTSAFPSTSPSWSFSTIQILLFTLYISRNVMGQYIPSQGHTRDINNNTLGARGEDDSQSQSQSKNLYLMSHDDFCLLAPSNPGTKISEAGQDVVSYCTNKEHKTRLIPDGTLKGVTYVKTPSWVQVSGSGDFTKMNISPNDFGGQFDSSEHTPEGATLKISTGGDPARNWVTMISADTFCMRACTGDPAYCPTQYDSLGCYFLTSNGVGWDDVWQDCEGDDGDAPGVIDGKTYTPGNGPDPTPSIPAVSNCQPGSSISSGQTAAAGSGSGSGSGSDTGKSGSASGSDVASSGESTTWLPVSTCLPCTATAGSGSGSEAASGAAATSSAPREGGAEGGGEPPQASAAASSAAPQSGSSNPFASGSGSASSAVSGPASAAGGSSAASGSGSSEAGGGQSGGTEQVGVTKLSPRSLSVSASTSTSLTSSAHITTAPEARGHSDEMMARQLGYGWMDRRDGETSTSGDQCCFTTWTPSVIGGTSPTGAAGGAKNGSGGSSSAGAGAGGSASASGKAGSASGSASLTGTKTAPATSVTSGSIGGKNGTSSNNGTTGVNGTKDGNNSDSSSYGRNDLWIIGGSLSKLFIVISGTTMGLVLGGFTLM